jgi:hypothetical protein
MLACVRTNLDLGRIGKAIGMKDLNASVVYFPSILVLLLQARYLAEAEVALPVKGCQIL